MSHSPLVSVESRGCVAEGAGRDDRPGLPADPGRVPAACTLLRAINLHDGHVIDAGETVRVLEADRKELLLQTTDGRITFCARPRETDIATIATGPDAG